MYSVYIYIYIILLHVYCVVLYEIEYMYCICSMSCIKYNMHSVYIYIIIMLYSYSTAGLQDQLSSVQDPGIPRFVWVRVGSQSQTGTSGRFVSVRFVGGSVPCGSNGRFVSLRFVMFRVLCWPVILSNIVCRCFKYHLGHKASYFQRHGKHTNGSVQSYIRWLGSNTVLTWSCSHHRFLELLSTPLERHKRFCSKLFPLTWK